MSIVIRAQYLSQWAQHVTKSLETTAEEPNSNDEKFVISLTHKNKTPMQCKKI